jgi:hypothetical protein
MSCFLLQCGSRNMTKNLTNYLQRHTINKNRRAESIQLANPLDTTCRSQVDINWCNILKRMYLESHIYLALQLEDEVTIGLSKYTLLLMTVVISFGTCVHGNSWTSRERGLGRTT